ncbi:DUF2487 family protein [Paenibacillus sp. DYY-L-2]|uniref:DUF2487 family protein n=1 Tax=Paenibacillus sp. DYY-L-2 TaxID=3447013 RepID=UPI003F4FA8F1
MKFSEVEQKSWEELRPYLDTCLIPVTGLTGKEQPYEVTGALEKLRDVMDWVEVPFQGRIVTYPSFQYGNKEIASQINEVCHHVKQAGFKFAIVISAEVELDRNSLPQADLVFTPAQFPDADDKSASLQIKSEIQRLWQEGSKG